MKISENCILSIQFYAGSKFCVIRADQKTGGSLLDFSGRTAMHGKSRVSSTIKYDCFKFDDSGNSIIRKTRLHCI